MSYTCICTHTYHHAHTPNHTCTCTHSLCADFQKNTAIGAMTLHKVHMTATDAQGNNHRMLVRKEDFENSTQTYNEDEKLKVEKDMSSGDFWVRRVRLQGQVGPMTVKLQAQVKVACPFQDAHGNPLSEFWVQGEMKITLCAGKASALMLRGHKMKRRGAGVGGGGGGESASQMQHSQAPELCIKCRSFEELDPLQLDAVDECGNPIGTYNRKVLLDFSRSSKDRRAVVSSRKADGLPAEQVCQRARDSERG